MSYCKHNKIDNLREALVKYGMNGKNPKSKSITYRIIERFLTDQSIFRSNKYQSSKEFLKAVKQRMKVNLITNKVTLTI